MADSWEDLGSVTDVFTIKNDWDTNPSQGFEPYRTVIQYPGSGIKLRNITDDVAISFVLHFCTKDKSEENALLAFFYARRGRASAFWLPVPKQVWELSADVNLTFPKLLVLVNSDPQWLRGYERMFMLLKNGDYISREVVSITTVNAPPLNPNIMTVVTDMDRVVKPADVEMFGKLLLVRFDQDELELKHDSTALAECDLSFKELPKEYADL